MVRSETLWRRLRTVPALIIGWAVVMILLPVLALVAAVVDLSRLLGGRRHAMALRLLAFLVVYLFAELGGVLAAGLIWLASGFGAARGLLIKWTYRLQERWTNTLWAAVRTLFALRLEVEGVQELGSGPLLVFARHTSIVDNLLPAQTVSRPTGIRLRYVLKRELQSDPAIDIVGNRLPNYFVARGSPNREREIEMIRALGTNLGPEEGVLIFPEGTRFTPEKREQAMMFLARHSPDLFELAKNLTNVLPPRPGGPLALLEASPADVVVLGHTGLEGFAKLKDVWQGDLVRRTVRVKLVRIPRHQIPTDSKERVEWLFGVWHMIDRWVGSAPMELSG